MSQGDQENQRVENTGVESSLARQGGLSYLEIPTADPRKSANFYEQVVGWKIEWRDRDDARFSDGAGYLIGRWVTRLTAFGEPGLLPYIYVESIDGAVEKVAANGGEVVRPTYAQGDLWIATVRDPAGNVIGLWQGGPRR